MRMISLALSLAFLSAPSIAHEGNRVDIEADFDTATAGRFSYGFQLVDEKLHKTLSDTDLAVSHEKKLHLLVFDASLKEFTHVHPEFETGAWKGEIDLPVDGNYSVWAQGALLDKTEFSTRVELKIQRGRPANALPPILGDVRSGKDGISVATIRPGRIVAGREAMLMIDLSRNNGTQPQITPLLGAFAHVVATPPDGKTLLHVHPMDGSNPNEGMAHATFPKEGNYRIWVQFMDAGVIRTVPLSVAVNKR